MNQIPFWRSSFGEQEIVQITNSIRNERISQGPITEEFENQIADLLDVPYVVVTTSGSTALLIACIAAGIGPGDEVIIPNRTWIATAHAPLLLGAKVIFTDVKPNIPIMDTSLIQKKITSQTKAIMPVHLNGRSVNMEIVNQIAKENDLVVIEDAAQAFLSKNKSTFLGCQSFAGCFSLGIAKLISTGQGGFLVLRDKKVYEKIKLIRTHGVSSLFDASYSMLGSNFKFTDLLASIGIEQIKRIPKRIINYNKIYTKYSLAISKLPFLKLIPVDIESGEIPIYIEVLCDERDKFVKFLSDNAIETKLFYPDLDTANYITCNDDFPNSRLFSKYGLMLPSGPDQLSEDIDKVIETMKKFKS